MANNEHQFENDIEALMTGELGWSKARKLGAAAPSTEHSEKALDLATLVKSRFFHDLLARGLDHSLGVHERVDLRLDELPRPFMEALRLDLPFNHATMQIRQIAFVDQFRDVLFVNDLIKERVFFTDQARLHAKGRRRKTDKMDLRIDRAQIPRQFLISTRVVVGN